MQNFDVIIIGGGAAGLMCAIEAGKRGRATLLIEHADKLGKKILISGGGRCNFTNLYVEPSRYQSSNEHFCKSAFSRYTQNDFIDFVKAKGIAFHEKKLGQLFCDSSAREIVQALTDEARSVGVQIGLNCDVNKVEKDDDFQLQTSKGDFSSQSLVIATGGASIPKMGATKFGLHLAQQFGLEVTETKAGLVPFVFEQNYIDSFKDLSGISIPAVVSCNQISFEENILLTHRGVSGPAILQISSFWNQGDPISINLLPNLDLSEYIDVERNTHPKLEVKNLLSQLLPSRFVERVFELWLVSKPLSQLNKNEVLTLTKFFHSWTLTPVSTEGYRTAEVMVGGVDTSELSSKTFEAKKVPGLYFIGEVVDVTGWLGGYNFQWAWSSGFCAGQFV